MILWSRLPDRMAVFLPISGLRFGHEPLSTLLGGGSPSSIGMLDWRHLNLSTYIFALLHSINGSDNNDAKTTAKATASTKTITPSASAIRQVLVLQATWLLWR